MAEDTVVITVCRIPLAYRRPGGKSLRQYVSESGYRDNPSALSAAAVTEFLRHNPELVDEWFLLSEDKRTSVGWYVIEEGGKFVVGQMNGARIEIADRIAACAEFIVREIGTVT
jgi:hypothetical protein